MKTPPNAPETVRFARMKELLEKGGKGMAKESKQTNKKNYHLFHHFFSALRSQEIFTDRYCWKGYSGVARRATLVSKSNPSRRCDEIVIQKTIGTIKI